MLVFKRLAGREKLLIWAGLFTKSQFTAQPKNIHLQSLIIPPSSVKCRHLSYSARTSTFGGKIWQSIPVVCSRSDKRFSLSSSQMAESSSSEELVAHHDVKNKRFVVKLGADNAILEYAVVRPGILNFYHTEVPEKLRGKSIGELLAKAAFDHVVEHNLKMKLTCTYLQHYYALHPLEKYKEHIVPIKSN